MNFFALTIVMLNIHKYAVNLKFYQIKKNFDNKNAQTQLIQCECRNNMRQYDIERANFFGKLLIVVVVVFLICTMPNTYLIYLNVFTWSSGVADFQKERRY